MKHTQEDPRVAAWRQAGRDGTLTKEAMKEAIAHLRGPRLSASHTSEKSRAKKRGPDLPDLDDMMKELGEL